ncbi:MAG: type II toxin-antitoxin system RelE/ParE family toxin [Stigonema ocellatum SAG 48.90 = DSM 106950]|nr:type II toxin-antitoxin system RelE/ParE family toxin [Stigonema ocellatum SAG 48.90 = DSM 106950]
MARINWTSQALDDLQAIGDFIARDTPVFSQVFVDKVFETVERFPENDSIRKGILLFV